MNFFDLLAALLAVTIWGINFVVIKIGLQGLPPVLFTALRFLFAAIPLVFLIPRPAIPLRLLAGYAMFQFALQFTLLFSGMQLGFPPGLASLVLQLQAFFTMGLAIFFLQERPAIPQWLGALIAFGGMGLVAMHLEGKATAIGFIMVIAGGFCWGVANIFTKKIGKTNPLALVVWGSLLAFPPILLASLMLEGPSAWVLAYRHLTWVSIGAIFFQSYPNTILGFGIWAILMRKYPTSMIAPFALLVPVTGMISATVLLDEPLQWWKIVAGVLVLAGLLLNQLGPKIFAMLSPAKNRM